ncbi:MAG: ATP-binding protein [Bacteroidales bacterium]|nr:ATP-binding protein [Bacteroidales bacterium]
MGLYLNPNIDNFLEAFNSTIYIDKSLVINEFNKRIGVNGKFICQSRARRFGKTMLQNMVCAYYTKGADAKEYFSKLKISKELTEPKDIERYHKYMNNFNVIKLDFNGFWTKIKVTEKYIFFDKLFYTLKEEFEKEFPNINFSKCDSVAECIERVYADLQEHFIILIDEYDLFVREKVKPDMFQQYLDFLNSLFKNDAIKPAISLAYLTGILPIVRDKIQSKLNNFDEYTMINAYPFEECIGFTKEEVKNLCKQYNLDEKEFKRWFDGYKIEDKELYNSNSVVQSILKRKFQCFWGQTGSFEAISDYLKFDFEGIREDVTQLLSGREVAVNVSSFCNTLDKFETKDDVFTYLIHLGYLTYNSDEKTCYIPNLEVKEQWKNAIERMTNFGIVPQIIKESRNLIEATIHGEEKLVAESLERSHSLVMNNWQYNNEACFASAIILSYIAGYDYYTIFQELPTGKGYADLVFIPYKSSKPALIIELKVDTVVETAINQIYDKKYNLHLEQYKGNMRFVGIAYNKETKKHTCKIEEW